MINIVETVRLIFLQYFTWQHELPCFYLILPILMTVLKAFLNYFLFFKSRFSINSCKVSGRDGRMNHLTVYLRVHMEDQESADITKRHSCFKFTKVIMCATPPYFFRYSNSVFFLTKIYIKIRHRNSIWIQKSLKN